MISTQPTICFREYGKILFSRSLAITIRSKIEEMMAQEDLSEKISLDFTGVAMVGSGFADECLAKLISKHGIDETLKKTVIHNCDPIVRMIITSAVTSRLLFDLTQDLTEESGEEA